MSDRYREAMRGSRGKQKPRPRGLVSYSQGELLAVVGSYPPDVVVVVYHRFTRFALAAKAWEQGLFRELDRHLEGCLLAKFLDQVKAAKAGLAGDVSSRDPEFQKAYPAVWEFVSIAKHGDGSTRQTATLLFFLEAGAWKVCLGDRDSGLSLWAAGETFLEALEALEAMLQSPSPQWRAGSKRTPRKP